jgi:hypothetical protein
MCKKMTILALCLRPLIDGTSVLKYAAICTFVEAVVTKEVGDDLS